MSNSLLDLVDVNAESAEGILFKGASVPFGMMMWGPNHLLTRPILGYSLTALSGAEMNDRWFDYISIRPTSLPLESFVGDLPSDDVERERVIQERTVTRENQGKPGYFCSRLPEGILVELTTTCRTGLGRFTYQAKSSNGVIVYANNIHIDRNNQRISGFHSKAGGYTAYFSIIFEQPFAEACVFDSSHIYKIDESAASDVKGCYVSWDTGTQVMMKIGMSFVSVDNAMLNLSSECPHWDFDGVRNQAAQHWQDMLSRIEVSSENDQAYKLFYTNLYRCLLHPNVFNDVNGDYLGFDHALHNAGCRTHYANYSGWDIYRTWVPLIAWLLPDIMSDMIQSLVVDAKEGGGAMPRWPVQNIETGTMEEGSATPIVVNGYMFGACNFDTQAAWEYMNRAESVPGALCQTTLAHPDLDLYLKYGYVPQGVDYNRQRSASFTLEYSMYDFALAQFARALGHEADYCRYMRLAGNWRNLLNRETGHIQPRNEDGSWFPEHLDPAHGHLNGFTEGNAAQYTWTIRQDLESLLDGLGGSTKAIARLDEFFRFLNARHDQPYCWIGNEPSLSIPWVYMWAGAPSKTQKVLHRILTEEWRPGTTPGAEDLGTLSAWYVWASMGLYPLVSGTDMLLLSSPQFSSIRIHLTNDQTLHIATERQSAHSLYVDEVTSNGKVMPNTWVSARELGSSITDVRFKLIDSPETKWGTAPENAPPSFSME
jgi:predicted alpha-1,2-mannosidase